MWFVFKFFGLLLVWNHWLTVKGNRSKKAPAEIHKSDFGKCNVFYERRSPFSRRTVLTVPLKRGSRFKIHPENAVDKFLKSLGFSTELQIGNAQFDRKVYIESDAEVLVEELRDYPRAQEIIIALFKDLAEKIVADGELLEVYYYGEKRDFNHSAELLIELGAFLDSVPSKRYGLFRDPNFYKALSFEFVITGYAFYGFVCLAKLFFNSNLIETGGLISRATFLTVCLILSLIFLNLFIFNKSARGHKILVENFFYIILGVPIASFFLMSDLNQGLDNFQTESHNLQIVSRRRPTSYHYRDYDMYGRRRTLFSRWSMFRPYYVYLDLGPIGYNFSKRFKVNRRTYYDASSANVEVGRGYFNQRYIKSIDF